MSNHVYKIIEVVGSSKETIEDAINTAIATCSKSIEHMDWFEVKETRGAIMDGGVGYYQVVLRVGFRVDEAS
jgi:flavin-binding protein dodecin